MEESIQFGSKTIHFHLFYSNRKTLGITVKPDYSIWVKAPLDADLDKIKRKVHKKAHWILKQQSFFLSFHPKQGHKLYRSGETFLFLGRQYFLKIEIAKEYSVQKRDKNLIVKAKNQKQAELILKKWYVDQARKYFNKLAKPLIEDFQAYDVFPDSIVLREMPTRWGSCTPKGKIILNPELIKAPRACIEYVIIHELCHLVHLDHNSSFFELQTKHMPSWKKWKERLEKLLA